MRISQFIRRCLIVLSVAFILLLLMIAGLLFTLIAWYCLYRFFSEELQILEYELETLQ